MLSRGSLQLKATYISLFKGCHSSCKWLASFEGRSDLFSLKPDNTCDGSSSEGLPASSPQLCSSFSCLDSSRPKLSSVSRLSGTCPDSLYKGTEDSKFTIFLLNNYEIVKEDTAYEIKQTNYLHSEVIDIIKTFLIYKNLKVEVQLKLLPLSLQTTFASSVSLRFFGRTGFISGNLKHGKLVPKLSISYSTL